MERGRRRRTGGEEGKLPEGEKSVKPPLTQAGGKTHPSAERSRKEEAAFGNAKLDIHPHNCGLLFSPMDAREWDIQICALHNAKPRDYNHPLSRLFA